MKKGQITIFVVMGLVLILVVGLVLFTTRSVRDAPPVEEEIEYIFEQAKVKQYIEQCLSSVSEQAIRKLGDKGGYIYPEEFGFISFPNMPTSGTALRFSPESEYVIPYWHYMKSSNNCKDCYFESGKPPIESIKGVRSVERQLADFVNNNLENCVDLSVFKEFEVEKNGEVDSKVIVGEKVIISAEYPLLIKLHNNDQGEVSEFETSIDVNLKKFFDFADEIIRVVKTGFFEKVTAELITVNSFGKNPTIPPISGVTSIEFKTPPMWIKQEVANNLSVILADNIQIIQILGARKSVIFESNDPYFEAFYSNMIANVNSPSDVLDDMSVDFFYLPWWKPYLKIKPGMGELIMESPATIPLPFFKMMFLKNQFYYYLSYPVVVSLEDTESFNGEGYSLKFAFEVNLRANRPYEFVDIEEDEEAVFNKESLFGDPNHWNSGEITIKTMNPWDNSYVNDVSLTFRCGNDEVFIGNSIVHQEGFSGLKMNLPVCIGGYISGFKSDYFVKSERIDTLLEVDDEVVINVEPKKSVDVVFKEKIVGKELQGIKMEWIFRSNSERDIALDERVIMVLTRETQPGEDEFVTQVIFYGNQTDIAKVELVTGSYEVNAYLFKNNVVIPEHEFSGETIPKLEFNESFYSGGLNLNSDTIGYFEVTADDLKKDTLKVTLLALEADDFDNVEDLEQIDKIDEYVIDNSQYFMPVFE